MEQSFADRRDALVVFLGVDTHSEAHVAVALDGAGRRTGELAVANSQAGYARLLGWALGFGDVVAAGVAAGVEGTGSYGAGLSRFLRAGGLRVLEVNRTSRQHVIGTASTTPATPRPLPARSWPGPPPGSPRAPTGRRSRCAPSGSPIDRR